MFVERKDMDDKILESKLLEQKIESLVQGITLEQLRPQGNAALWSKTYTETKRDVLAQTSTPVTNPQNQAVLDRLKR
jgi:hypothetical protein